HTAQQLPQLELLVGGAGGLDQGPTDEGEPDTASQAPGQEEGYAGGHQQPAHQLAGQGGDPGRPGQAAGGLPDGRAQQPPPVQREPRDQVEAGQQKVGPGKVPERPGQRPRQDVAAQAGNGPEQPGQEAAGE